MALENLFATDPQLPQTSTKKMPEDSGSWAEVLTQQLRELYPDVGTLPISVEFRRKEDSAGTAIGALHVVSMEAGKSLHVPFIIRKFELHPLDVWMESDSQAVHPLTVDTFKEVFFMKGVAEGLDQRPTDATGTYFNDPSLWTTNYPPLQGRYSYASAGYKLLDLISDTLSETDIAAFRKSLEKNATSLQKYTQHGHKEILQKLAAKKGKGPMSNDFAASALRLIPQTIASVKKENRDKYTILSAADRLFDLASSESPNEYTREKCLEWCGKITGAPENFMNEVDQEGEKMLMLPSSPKKGVFIFDDVREKPENADKFAVYHCRTESGLGLHGVVLPHVVNFKGQRQGYKLFISPNHSSMQNQLAGIHEPDSAAIQKILKPSPARTGQTGTFVFIDDGKAIATQPVTITAVQEYGPLTAMTLDGKKIRISRGYSHSSGQPVPAKGDKKSHVLDIHGMIEVQPDEYVIPQKMLWIPMEDFRDLVATPQAYFEKVASTQMTTAPTTIRYTGIVYEVDGIKTAMDSRRLGLFLASSGCDLEKTAQIIKKAKASGRVRVYGLAPQRKTADIIKEAGTTWERLEKMCASLRQDLVKVAAEFDDSATVDALLSLNFINPDNISKFVAYKPIFEKVTDYLAELAVASRLGMKDIPESAVVIAMAKLRDLIEGLKRLEIGIKKTAAAPASPAGGVPTGEAGRHFANGMVDAELNQHMHLEEARKNPIDLLAYFNGKRLAIANQTTAAMSLGMQPPAGMKPMKKPEPKPVGGKK